MLRGVSTSATTTTPSETGSSNNPVEWLFDLATSQGQARAPVAACWKSEGMRSSGKGKREGALTSSGEMQKSVERMRRRWHERSKGQRVCSLSQVGRPSLGISERVSFNPLIVRSSTKDDIGSSALDERSTEVRGGVESERGRNGGCSVGEKRQGRGRSLQLLGVEARRRSSSRAGSLHIGIRDQREMRERARVFVSDLPARTTCRRWTGSTTALPDQRRRPPLEQKRMGQRRFSRLTPLGREQRGRGS